MFTILARIGANATEETDIKGLRTFLCMALFFASIATISLIVDIILKRKHKKRKQSFSFLNAATFYGYMLAVFFIIIALLTC